jgi:hypothetical protein
MKKSTLATLSVARPTIPEVAAPAPPMNGVHDHVPVTPMTDDQYVPLEEVEDQMLVDDVTSAAVTPVTHDLTPVTEATAPAPSPYCTYYRAVFLTDRDQIEALIQVSKEYPLRPPLFRIKKIKKKPVSGSNNTVSTSHVPAYPAQIRTKMDEGAVQQLTASAKEPSYDSTLQQIETELNANSSALVSSDSERLNILPLLLNRLRVSTPLEINPF